MQDRLKTFRSFILRIKKVLVIATIAGLVIIPLSTNNGVLATGNGSPTECDNPNAKADNNQNLLTYTAPSGNIIIGVCIHSGNNMFGGTQHSGLLGDGTYENGCYTVSGINTQIVTVTRIGSESPSCQGLSHIDILYSVPDSSPTPTPSPSPTSAPTPSPTATPLPSPTSEPTPTATPTISTTSTTTSNTTNGNTDGAVAGASATASNEPSTSTPQGEVLGASAELPATGTETIWLLLGIFSFLSGAGLIVLGLI